MGSVKMNCQILTVVCVYVLCLSMVFSTKLTDVTEELFGGNNLNSYVAAFGDYNADKLVDIFLLNDAGKNIGILCARQDKSFVRHNLTNSSDIAEDDVIVGLIPTDFDGDAVMDLLVLTKKKDLSGPVSLTVFWGEYNEQMKMPEPGSHKTLEWKLRDEPLLFDFDADMHPDLLGELENKTRVVIRYNRTSSRTFDLQPFPVGDKSSEFLPSQSSAFLDLDGDLYPDLWLTTVNGYELWVAQDGHWHLNQTIPFPPDVKVDEVRQSSFADTDQDGIMDHILPVCKGTDCKESQIYIYNKGNWSLAMEKINVVVKSKAETWSFRPPATDGFVRFPVTLRIGDYNMDGFPDAIAAIRSKNEKDASVEERVVLFQNVPCENEDPECQGNRKFVPDTPYPLWHSDNQNVLLATFFDLNENGIIDILAVAWTTKDSDRSISYPIIRAYRQTSTTDACFVKVTVTSGLCYKNCSHGWKPFGVNQPGPSVKYETTAVEGKYQVSCAAQLSQSAHFALQPPYAFFGLGMTPNFVDKVTVGIANNKNETRRHDWTQLIPNSQLIVIPYPYINPNKWTMKLFVTPSRLVLITGAVLIGACGFLAGIIGILHWRERREDQKEKRQESHKFHFDAM